MSRIDELITELAPSGVRYFTLSEVAEYSPTRVGAPDLDETNFVGVDNLVANKGGRIDASYPPNTARLTAYEPGDVLLGNIRPYLKKAWLATNAGGCSGDVLALRIKREHRGLLDPTFLYYLLSSDRFFAYDMQHAKGAKMPRGNKVAILNYRIPVPPLEVQREIVRILDRFTSLEAELEAELEARRVQYAYYRDSLFPINDSDSTKWCELGEVASVFDGTHQTPRYTASGIKFVSVENIRSLYSSQKFISEEDFDRLYKVKPRRDDVLMTRIGSIGACTVVDSDEAIAYYVSLALIRPNPELVNSRFLKYLLESGIGAKELRKRTLVNAVPIKINLGDVGRLRLPFPDLENQAQIVSILDKFDALVNDLTVGLPAELVARRTQYEYYRDKLLTFEEASA